MAGSSTRLGLPFPNLTDSANVPSDVHNLVLALDGKVVSYYYTAPGDLATTPSASAQGSIWFCAEPTRTTNYGWNFSNGSSWIQGATGAAGAQGPQGTSGVQGYQGSMGNQGAQGYQGTTGVQGAQGAQGVAGIGAQGAQGYQGTTGVQGAQGNQGSGPQGNQGAQGNQGITGNQGVQGSPGSSGAVVATHSAIATGANPNNNVNGPSQTFTGFTHYLVITSGIAATGSGGGASFSMTINATNATGTPATGGVGLGASQLAPIKSEGVFTATGGTGTSVTFTAVGSTTNSNGTQIADCSLIVIGLN